MLPSKRILLVGIAIEILLAALGAWLITQLASGGFTATTTPAEAASAITAILGAIMGGLGGLLILTYFVLRARGK